MANLKIASPPVSAKPAPSVQSADQKADGIDFAAKLKDGLVKEAKKEQTKKTNALPAAPANPHLASLTLEQAKTSDLEGLEKIELAPGAEPEAKSKGPKGLVKGEEEEKLSAENSAKLILEHPLKQPALITTAGLPAFAMQAPVKSASAQAKMQLPAGNASELAARSGAKIQTDLNLSELSNLAGKLGLIHPTGESTSEEAFDIESLKLSEGTGLTAGESVGVEPKTTAPAKLSTVDYLNLRELGKKDSKPVSMEAALGDSFGTKKLKQDLGSPKDLGLPLTHAPLTQAHLVPVKLMDAQVTAGSSGKTVLSSDSVNQLSSTVNLMSKAQQDGEIKIRLRPDHLGELVLSVKTQGNQVSIQIKAHGSEAKRIIEESLGSLKDNFAKQNLTLSQIDVVTAPNPTQTQDQGMSMNFNDSRQNFGQDTSGFNQGQHTRQELHYEDGFSPSILKPAQAARVNRYQANAGLDLIA